MFPCAFWRTRFSLQHYCISLQCCFEHISPSSEIVIFNKFAAQVQFITMFLYSLYSGLLHNWGKECYTNKPPLLRLTLCCISHSEIFLKKALKSRKLKQTSATALLCIFDEHEQVNPAIQTWLHTWIAGCCAVILIRCTPTHYWISFLVVCNCMRRARKQTWRYFTKLPGLFLMNEVTQMYRSTEQYSSLTVTHIWLVWKIKSHELEQRIYKQTGWTAPSR